MDYLTAYMVFPKNFINWYSASVYEDISEALRDFRAKADEYENDIVSLVRIRYKLRSRLVRIIHTFSIGISFPGCLNEYQIKILDVKILLHQDQETAIPSRGYV
ncbi:hypothetical protein DSECCO2_550900 [anaerobic digester metagenome]